MDCWRNHQLRVPPKHLPTLLETNKRMMKMTIDKQDAEVWEAIKEPEWIDSGHNERAKTEILLVPRISWADTHNKKRRHIRLQVK